jgi:hypothetical protein
MDALPQFELLRPKTLEALLAARAAHPQASLLGGGTDLLVNIRRGIVAPPVLIEVNEVAELRAIAAAPRQRSPSSPRIPRLWGTIPRSRRRRPISPGRPSVIWAPSAAISVSTRAASFTTRANGGATLTGIA